MDISAKLAQGLSIYRNSGTALPLILDMLRLKRGPYSAECRGLKFDLVAESHEWYTLYENIIHNYYFQNGIAVKEGDVVIDIGANFGAFTAVVSRMVGATGRVVSFEPNPHVFGRLQRVVEVNNLDNVVVRNEAVSNVNGKMPLFLQKRSSLATTFSTIDGRDTDSTHKISVPVISIEAILRSFDHEINLLKIDCEGGEYAIFDGLSASNLSNVRQISMETHKVPNRSTSELVKKLEDAGFTVICERELVTARKPNNC
jgi:FkbM family methyltransferase